MRVRVNAGEVRKVLAPPSAGRYTRLMSRSSRPSPHVIRTVPGGARARAAALAALAFAALAAAAALASPRASAQPRDRVDGTLPALQAPQRGERVTGTRAVREAGEARLREELLRQAELDALFNPHRAAWSGAFTPIYPTVIPPFGPGAGVPAPFGVQPFPGAKVPLPCPPGACPPPKPSPRPYGAAGPHEVPGGWGAGLGVR